MAGMLMNMELWTDKAHCEFRSYTMSQFNVQEEPRA